MNQAEKSFPLIEVSAKELPVFCPNPSIPAGHSHPRVFIDVSHGQARCPYCSTRYQLREGEIISNH